MRKPSAPLAEDPEITVAEIVIRVARERDVRVVVVGAHTHAPLLGATARAMIKEAPCPALVVRDAAGAVP